MTKRKIYLLIQSALCVLIALLLAVSAVRIFVEGSAYQAAGHPSEWIYTREKVAAALALILPLHLSSGSNILPLQQTGTDQRQGR